VRSGLVNIASPQIAGAVDADVHLRSELTDRTRPDYTSAVVSNLSAGLREQDAGTELIAVKCEASPQLQATVKGRGPRDVISAQQARFDLQVLVRDGNGQHWRLRGRMTCTGDRLDTDEPAVDVTFDLASAEAV
jgi:hypothetical protein